MAELKAQDVSSITRIEFDWAWNLPHEKRSGYQAFITGTMPEVKMKPEIAPKDRIGELAKMWMALTEEQRGQWKTKGTSQ